MPEYDVVDIGVRCVYGKIPLTLAVRDLLPVLAPARTPPSGMPPTPPKP